MACLSEDSSLPTGLYYLHGHAAYFTSELTSEIQSSRQTSYILR